MLGTSSKVGTRTGAEALAEARDLAGKISQVFGGLPVEWANPTSADANVLMTAVDESAEAEQLADYLRMFHDETRHYPACLFATNVNIETTGPHAQHYADERRLSRLLLTAHNDYRFPEETVARTAIPDPWLPGQLIYSIHATARLGYRRHVVHHELYHYLDWARDSEWDRGNAAWERCNPRGFAYSSSGREAQTADASEASGLAGFVSRYAEASLDEDRADTFAHMVTNTPRIRELYARDEGLRGKVDWIKREIETFCPDMNEEWWGRRFPLPEIVSSSTTATTTTTTTTSTTVTGTGAPSGIVSDIVEK